MQTFTLNTGLYTRLLFIKLDGLHEDWLPLFLLFAYILT